MAARVEGGGIANLMPLSLFMRDRGETKAREVGNGALWRIGYVSQRSPSHFEARIGILRLTASPPLPSHVHSPRGKKAKRPPIHLLLLHGECPYKYAGLEDSSPPLPPSRLDCQPGFGLIMKNCETDIQFGTNFSWRPLTVKVLGLHGRLAEIHSATWDRQHTNGDI